MKLKNENRLIKKYIPMTETAYYILLALSTERHGYGILGHVKTLTDGRLSLGAGTIYGTISRMEKDGLVRPVSEYDRRKTYLITDIGRGILNLEIVRLDELLRNGRAGDKAHE